MSDERAKVVIIGAGFGGIETAKALGRAAVHGQGLKKVCRNWPGNEAAA